MMRSTKLSPLFDFAAASQARPGEGVSGDRFLIERYPGGWLVSAVDGLGHGARAAETAEAACDALRRRPEDPVAVLLAACHQQLRGTRGVTMSLASIADSGDGWWLGVGNVAGGIFDRAGDTGLHYEPLRTHPGVVGVRVPPMEETRIGMRRGRTLVLVTDGIRSDFAEGSHPSATPELLANSILSRSARETDDALVLVLRWR